MACHTVLLTANLQAHTQMPDTSGTLLCCVCQVQTTQTPQPEKQPKGRYLPRHAALPHRWAPGLELEGRWT